MIRSISKLIRKLRTLFSVEPPPIIAPISSCGPIESTSFRCASNNAPPDAVPLITDCKKPNNHPEKCVILVPCNSPIEHKTDESLRILESRGYEVWRMPGWSAIDQGRNRMAYDAIYNRNFEEVFWIDGDINFNPDDVDAIRAWDKDIVAGAYPMKGWPVMAIQPIKGETVTFKENGGLKKIMCAATGFLCIKAGVFHKIKEQLKLPECNTSFSAPQIPFFRPDMWNLEGEPCYLGEDFSFCLRARDCGFPIWLDTGIKLGHIGKYTYEWEDIINQTGMAKKITGTVSFKYIPIQSNSGTTG